jgi:soluble lytic murein transglycosylase-like protein
VSAGGVLRTSAGALVILGSLLGAAVATPRGVAPAQAAESAVSAPASPPSASPPARIVGPADPGRWEHGVMAVLLAGLRADGSERSDLPGSSVPLPVSPTASSSDPAGPADAGPMPASSPGSLGALVPARIRRWGNLIEDAARAYALDPNLLAAVMMTESGGDPNATSARGAVGLMQVVGGSYDPAINIGQGASILARDLAHYHGDLVLALAAYNAGVNAVDRFGGIPPYLETQTYIFEVLNRYYLYAPG